MDHNEIEVSFDELLTAASKLPKSFRAPAGSKATIPKDTELLADSEGVLVNTPVMGTIVHSNRGWKYNISVDAKKLVSLLKSIGSIGATGNIISLSVSDRELWIRFKKTRSSLYTIWRKSDEEST